MTNSRDEQPDKGTCPAIAKMKEAYTRTMKNAGCSTHVTTCPTARAVIKTAEEASDTHCPLWRNDVIFKDHKDIYERIGEVARERCEAERVLLIVHICTRDRVTGYLLGQTDVMRRIWTPHLPPVGATMCGELDAGVEQWVCVVDRLQWGKREGETPQWMVHASYTTQDIDAALQLFLVNGFRVIEP